MRTKSIKMKSKTMLIKMRTKTMKKRMKVNEKSITSKIKYTKY